MKQVSSEGLKWYQDARFGMFIHWGLYSILALGEWVMHNESIPDIHVLDYVSDCVTLRDVPTQLARAALLKDGSPLRLTRRGENMFLTIPPQQRDEADTVIRLEE